MFSKKDLKSQLGMMGAGDTIACSDRLTSPSEQTEPAHTRRGLYDGDEAEWLRQAGAAHVAAPHHESVAARFDGDDLETQLGMVGACDCIACGERLASGGEETEPAHTRRGLYDGDEADWLRQAGAAHVAAPRSHPERP